MKENSEVWSWWPWKLDVWIHKTIDLSRSSVCSFTWIHSFQWNRMCLDVEDSYWRSISTLSFAFFEFPIVFLCWFLTLYKYLLVIFPLIVLCLVWINDRSSFFLWHEEFVSVNWCSSKEVQKSVLQIVGSKG